MRGAKGTDELLGDGTPQIALIGRSNVGKSSLINSLTDEKDLARTSNTPGRTQEINIYSINRSLYLLDFPGYGFAKVPGEVRNQMRKMIWWYLFESSYKQKKLLLVIDANIGPTKDDLEMLSLLREGQKDVIVVANKIDKIKPSRYKKCIEEIQAVIPDMPIIPYSSVKKIGRQKLLEKILK